MDKEHLDRFVLETEKFEKLVESLTKKKLSTPSSLEMQWRVSVTRNFDGSPEKSNNHLKKITVNALI